MLEHLHTGHQGITKYRRLARPSVWWPSISFDIETYVKQCRSCLTSKSQAPEPMLSTPLPSLPWQHIAADFFHFKSSDYLLIVDYYSRYPEIAVMPTTTASRTVSQLKSVFAHHGVPEMLTTNNGPQFTSQKFSQFASAYHFTHNTSSPPYP